MMRRVIPVTLAIISLLAATAISSPTRVESNNKIRKASGELAESIGIETLGGVFTPILEAGLRVPVTKSQIFSTAADNQSQITIHLFRGNAALAKANHALGTFEVRDIPPAPRGVPQVEVSFIVDNEGVLLSAVDLRTKRELQIKKK